MKDRKGRGLLYLRFLRKNTTRRPSRRGSVHDIHRLFVKDAGYKLIHEELNKVSPAY